MVAVTEQLASKGGDTAVDFETVSARSGHLLAVGS
jgi:hypothetical protein